MTFKESKEDTKTVIVTADTNKKKSGAKSKTLKKESSKKNDLKIKASKKTLKELKEKQAEETLINHCKSMSNYIANQNAIENLMDEITDEQNDDIRSSLITDEFLRGFQESEEYASALKAYRKRLESGNILG